MDKCVRCASPTVGALKVTGAARYLGLSANTLRKYTDLGIVRAKRLPGGDRIYRQEWLDDFIENLPDGTHYLN